MRFKVPQDVQREDQILFFITLRQLVILLMGGGISYLLFVNLKKSYDLNTLENIIIWIPAVISAAFAFLKIKGISLFKFILLIFEQTIFRPNKRYWVAHGGDCFFSMTNTVYNNKKTKKENSSAKEISTDKIEKLKKFLDKDKSGSILIRNINPKL